MTWDENDGGKAVINKHNRYIFSAGLSGGGSRYLTGLSGCGQQVNVVANKGFVLHSSAMVSILHL